MTVNAFLPSGETTVWHFDIHLTSENCLSTSLTPPVTSNQHYNIGDALTFGQVAEFSTFSGCNLVVYSYDISENDWITGFNGNTGDGRLVYWGSSDYTKAGEYTVTTYATNYCTSAQVSYSLIVTYDPKLIPIKNSDQVYIVTQATISLVMAEFDSWPANLDISYSYSLSDAAAEAVVTSWDPFNRTMSLFYDVDVVPAGGPSVPFKDYIVTITG